MRPRFALALLLACSAACGGDSASQPPAAPSGATAVSSGSATDTTVSFSGLVADGAPVVSYTEAGMQVTMTAGAWRARTTYGSPAPFVQFQSSAGGTATGSIQVALPAPAFFKSIDLYSSTTTIPYVITGSENGIVAFTLSGTVSNTLGTFRTVTNSTQLPIDTLSIVLTNSSAACCANLMGLDTIVFTNTPTGTPPLFGLTGTVTDSTSGAPLAGASVLVTGGPDTGRSATTDPSGGFAFANLSAGLATITVSATNYLAATQTVSVGTSPTVVFPLKPSPTVTPPAPTPASSATVIGFDGLTVNGASVTNYAESGFTVSATAAPWTAVTTYGHPAPFIEFYAATGTTLAGQVTVTAAGATFTFASVDLYSSTTTIPYVMTGVRGGVTVFTLTGTVPNTFGAFGSVVNANTAPIDTLTIALTNTSAACCRNPMGLDNIVVVRK